jgi:ribose 5-phosphate isomerase B
MGERIPIGSDHAGFQLKEIIKGALRKRGFEPDDVGTASEESVDYPDFAKRVAQQVSDGTATRGILMCGTGLGMACAANRFPHVRAAVAWTPEIAELSRRHNNANVLALPARFLNSEDGVRILERWLETPFEGGRHERRVEKIEVGE